MAYFSNRPELAPGPAMEMWRRTLNQIPTHFGRLVCVARLRDSSTGRYSQQSLTELLGRDITDRTLANSHHQVFAEWIAFPLSKQKADLDEYLNGTGRSDDPSAYRDFAPATAHEVERQLYLTDLETLLALLRVARGGAFSIPEA